MWTIFDKEYKMEIIKDNPDLVDELIDERWMMDPEEFDRKYATLNASDMLKVASATIAADGFFIDDNFIDYEEEDEEDEYEEELNVYDAAMIWASNGKDCDYMFGYSEEELEEALEY